MTRPLPAGGRLLLLPILKRVAILLPFLVLLLQSVPAAALQQKHVLLLHSHHQGYAWSDNITEGIRNILAQAPQEIELSVEYLDTQQHSPEHLFPLLEKLLLTKFRQHQYRFDAVIVADDAALRFILPRRQLLLPGVPLVFCGINDLQSAMLAGQPDITGVIEEIDLLETVRLALRLQPEMQHLAVISDITDTGRINLQRFEKVRPKLPPSLEVIELAGLPRARLEMALRRLPPDTFLLHLSYYRDPLGESFNARESVRLVQRNTGAPIYAAWGFIIEAGALGGEVVSGTRQGEKAATMALRILQGEAAAGIPVLTKSPNVSMFNYQELQRFGISTRALPAGSILVNEPDTFYYRHKLAVWGLLFFIVFQTSGILALAVNMVWRRRAERNLRRSEARFRSYFELGLIGMAVGTPEARWLAVNDRLCDILGYTRPELVGKSWIDLTLPEDRPATLALFEKLTAGEADGFETEKRYLRQDGAVVEAGVSVKCSRLEDGQVDYIVALVQDVTARRQAERELAKYRNHLEELVEERSAALTAANELLQREILARQKVAESLRESEEKYRTLVERANDGIFILQDSVLKYVNPQLAVMLGYTVSELLDSDLRKIVSPETQTVLAARYAKRVAGMEVPPKYETLLLHRNGQSLDVEFNVGLIPYEGRPASLIFVRDIRERKELEEERGKTGKLESLGVLAGGIAHDFNNLLTGILGNISFAKTLAEPGGRLLTLLNSAERASLRTRDLVRQLVTFSEGGAPIKERITLNTLLDSTVLFGLSGSAVEHRFQIQEDLWPVECDPGQIRQLFANLVLNAREAMPEGGMLEVKAVNKVLRSHQIGQLPAGHYVRVSLQDNGIGIPPQNLPKIFDPYFTTKQMGAKKGMGLGLSIVYSIVRRHSGHIQVTSQPDQGTTVTIHLPAAQALAAADSGQGNTLLHGRGRILVMDDEALVREVAAEILTYLGYEVVTTATGEQALASYQEALAAGRGFDAVLLDLTIKGGMGGEKTVSHLLRLDPQATVLVSSGFSNDPILARYQEHGFQGVVHKPYRLRELGLVLQEVLNRKRG